MFRMHEIVYGPKFCSSQLTAPILVVSYRELALSHDTLLVSSKNIWNFSAFRFVKSACVS
jgi:hypothetical protein